MRHQAFTLIEILTVLAITAVLSSLIFVAFKSGIQRAKEAKCGANLKAIYFYLQAYAQDSNGEMPKGIPNGKTYRNPTLLLPSLDPYVTNKNVFYCPSHYRRPGVLNGYNPTRWAAGDFSYFYYHRSGSGTDPRRNFDRNTAMLMSDPFNNATTNPVAISHAKGFKILRLNGSVEFVKNKENIQEWMLYKE